jgi:hypothetical protein
MAAGLQCPGCGHVHPAGLPEIARGDATFRCYGCYRTLSVPEGWTGRPTPRPASNEASVGAGAPPGAGTRDARRARLAGRGFGRRAPASSTGAAAAPGATGVVGGAAGSGAGSSVGAGGVGAGLAAGASGVAAGTGEDATQLVPATGRGRGGAPPGAALAAGAGARPPLVGAVHPPLAADPASASRPGAAAVGRPPLGWVAPRRSGRPVPAAVRAVVWAVAFGLAFVVTVLGLKEAGVLGVNTAIDLYAGTGVRRFGVLLVVLPLWAVLSAVIAHFTLEGLARRRRPRPVSRRSAANPTTHA